MTGTDLGGIGQRCGLSEDATNLLIKYCQGGGGSISKCARMYGVSARTARRWASSPEWAKAVEIFTAQQLRSSGPEAMAVLTQLMRESGTPAKVKADCAKFILNIVHSRVQQELPVASQKESAETLKELNEQIGDLARQLGMNAVDVTPPKVIEHEPTKNTVQQTGDM